MATREKKLSVGRKQNMSSPVPPKENVIATATASPTSSVDEEKINTTNSDEETHEEPQTASKVTVARGASLVKKLTKNSPKKKKATLPIKLKPKLKKAIKPKLIKSIMNNPKNAEAKKKLLKTCKHRGRKPRVLKNDKAEESQPPVLEPIQPISNEDLEVKQTIRKKPGRPPRIDNYAKKPKIESDQSQNETTSPPETEIRTKRVYRRKIKVENQPPATPPSQSLDDVMNDLTSLIKSGEVVKEEPEVLSESGKSDLLKPKRIIKRKKKENIENTLSKLSPSERKVIDMLDLNVRKFQGISVTTRRRHSIEKFPIGSPDVSNMNQSSIFNNLPRCISPRSKLPRLRQTVEAFNRRSNPYKTRSDSPARILRNGKHRKLKDLQLLEGLDVSTHKRRRRNCSEFSGSELSISKLSGYESDSSFSDMSSLHGGVENNESKDIEAIKSENKEIFETTEDFAQMANSAKIKRSLSVDNMVVPSSKNEQENNFTDTNSNLCLSKENDIGQVPIKTEDELENIAISPSLKVPEKSLILDIMKQTFNEVCDENKEDKKQTKQKPTKSKPDTVSPLSFYGNKPVDTDVEIKNETECVDDPVINKPEDTILDENSVLPANSPPPEEIPIQQETITENNSTIENGDIQENNISTENVAIINGADSAVDDTEAIPNGNHDESEVKIEETPENLAIKENILQALGLQSLKAAKEAKLNKEKSEVKHDCYTGTLKTVIKINRGDKKKGRNSMKMTLHKYKTKNSDYDANGVDDGYKVMKDGPSTSWKHGGQSSDTAGAHRKSHYSNRSNMDGSSEHTSDGETAGQEGTAKALVIPEKASSFSIHPDRLCKDECSYCFGKFGLFDTPCHIAQMKSIDRQNKILAAEKHLTTDSCLCDACYRHVDRKANTPSYTNKSYKRSTMVAPGPRQDHCHVLGCGKVSSNILRRKWIIKMRKSICEVMNIDLDNPGLHSIPICDEHYSALEHLMVCAMCKRRLAKNHVHYLGPETIDLNCALQAEGVPLRLSDKPVVCKLCKCFATILLKNPEDRIESSSNFLQEYKKRLLHFNNIVPMDEAAAEEPIIIPSKDKIDRDPLIRTKKRKLSKHQSIHGDTGSDSQVEQEKSDQSRVPSSDSTNQSRPESPSDYMVDYNTLIPTIAMECGSDSESKKDQPITTKCSTHLKKIPRPETVKQAVEISKKLKSDKSSDIAVQRLGSNPSISVRQLFPCEEDLPLQGHIEFGNVKERTPEGWEKCTSVVQYDMETKHLWQELQKPYGNQSSFLRHLILLEKYFRNGDLVLAPNASHHSINYSESVHNRLRAYDNIPSSAGNVQPISMLPFNKPQKSNSGIITSTNAVVKDNQTHIPIINAANIPKNTPLTISQLNSPPLIQPAAVPPQQVQCNKQKSVGAPPGLISLQPGTNKPIAPLVKPQPQKIKFPITKNWRPNLIPIDPTKKNTERKTGLVQVISGGKPYHITLEDYKKMCAIKKSFELRQKKRLQEQVNANKSANKSNNNYNSVLKSMVPRKGLVISKSSTSTTTTSSISTSLKNNVIEPEINILEKLDKQVEKLESRLSETKATSTPLSLPKIPKSLTVIPQTVTRKPSRPSSPVLLITSKPKQIPNKS